MVKNEPFDQICTYLLRLSANFYHVYPVLETTITGFVLRTFVMMISWNFSTSNRQVRRRNLYLNCLWNTSLDQEGLRLRVVPMKVWKNFTLEVFGVPKQSITGENIFHIFFPFFILKMCTYWHDKTNRLKKNQFFLYFRLLVSMYHLFLKNFDVGANFSFQRTNLQLSMVLALSP